MGFSRQQYWSGLPWPLSGDLPNPVIKHAFLRSPALAGRLFTRSATWEAQIRSCYSYKSPAREMLLSVLPLFISLWMGAQSQSLVRGTKILYAVYPETRLPKMVLINKITKAKNRKHFKHIYYSLSVALCQLNVLNKLTSDWGPLTKFLDQQCLDKTRGHALVRRP